jgi:hypothetical protein
MESSEAGGFRIRLRPSIAYWVGVPGSAERQLIVPPETFVVFNEIAYVDVGFNW